MNNGLLGKAALLAATDTVVYTVPADTKATCNINVVNRGADPVKVKVAIATAGVPADADYIEYNRTLAETVFVERTGLKLSAGERVVVWSDLATVSVRVHGVEESA